MASGAGRPPSLLLCSLGGPGQATFTGDASRKGGKLALQPLCTSPADPARRLGSAAWHWAQPPRRAGAAPQPEPEPEPEPHV